MSGTPSPAPRAEARRLLVTGAAGFIGANFAHYWMGRHPQDRFVVLDALTYAGNLASLAELRELPGFRFVRGDIRDREGVEGLLREERIDTLVNFAAESHVDRSISGPGVFLDVNVMGTHALLEAARNVWQDPEHELPDHRFHHVSTDEVYGELGPDDPPFHEATPYRPNSPYAASKAASDHIARAYQRTYGLNVTISNCSNNYGPFHYPEKLIPLCIVSLLHGRELPIYGDGSNVRDWLFVEDHCAGIERVLERGVAGRTYNLGGRSERSNLSLIHSLCDLFDEMVKERPELADRFPESRPSQGEASRQSIRFVRDRPGHDWRYAVDITRASEELGFEPSVDLRTGLQRTLEWYVEQGEWWRPLLDRTYDEWMREHYRE